MAETNLDSIQEEKCEMLLGIFFIHFMISLLQVQIGHLLLQSGTQHTSVLMVILHVLSDSNRVTVECNFSVYLSCNLVTCIRASNCWLSW